jgi:hypothetical protein
MGIRSVEVRGVEGEQRLEVRERGLGSFVDVDRGAHAVVAPAGGEVVHGLTEPVAPEEPLEGVQRRTGVSLGAGGAVGLHLRLHQRSGVERLLASGSRAGLAATTAEMTREPQMRSIDADLVRIPLQRPQALAHEIVVAEPDTPAAIIAWGSLALS